MSSEADPLVVSNEEEGLRLDRFLKKRFEDYSRTYFQTLIDQNLVLVNGSLIKKGQKVMAGDEVEVEFALTQEISVTPEAIPLDILYEDAHLLAINKPVGMVVHPATGNWSGTFVNALLFHCGKRDALQTANPDALRPGIVHRLDKETSGVLLAAKDEFTQRKLVELFANRQIYKEYSAICVGNPGERLITGAIGRHPNRRKEMAVVEDKGKEAITYCQTLAHNETLAYVKLVPKTGRTHQLRVHLQSIGFPILGDAVYGSTSANKKYGVSRQLLHAHILRFLHPHTQEEIELKAPLPHDINRFIRTIQNI